VFIQNGAVYVNDEGGINLQGTGAGNGSGIYDDSPFGGGDGGEEA